MTRTIAREIAMHLAFEQVFSNVPPEELLAQELTEIFADRSVDEPLYKDFPDEEQLGYISGLVEGVARCREELDSRIEKYAKDWRISRIDRVAASILRVAIYLPQGPDKVAINEAVEIAKKYLESDVVGFINGILGSFIREERSQEQEPAEGE